MARLRKPRGGFLWCRCAAEIFWAAGIAPAIQRITAATMLLIFSACAALNQSDAYSFEFDAFSDSPEVEVLDYKYGSSSQPGASNPDYLRRQGKSLQGFMTYGRMPRGSLFMKWKIKNTGVVLEDTVNLAGMLPSNMSGHRIYPVIKEAQLYIYLISPKEGGKCPATWEERVAWANRVPPHEQVFHKYCNYTITTLYPK